MIEALHADIALTAMNGTLRSHDHARETDFEPGYESFLTVETVNDQVILKVSPEPQRVLVIRLFGDQSGVRRSSHVKEKVDQDPEN